ncbi:MAG TPA: hypothetical protein PKD86_02920 [Gemmatales bacterium]|nr:hypothetical protein [Gemmatales bacterium]HMP58284.1 hypothetical protein [Gemmatales bacterium]
MPKERLRPMQIIVFALLQSLLFFALIAAFIAANSGPRPALPVSDEVLRYALLGITGLCVVLSLVIPRWQVKSAIDRIAAGTWRAHPHITQLYGDQDGDDAKLASVYQSQLIVGCALLEAPAAAGAVLTLATGSLEPLIVTAILFGLMLLRFPLSGTVSHWLDAQRGRIEARRLELPGARS